jgi:DNA invertase Pin-like site-specific DNA recombinase
MALFRLAYGRVSTDQQNIELQIAQFETLGYDELFVEKVSGRRRDRTEFVKLIDRAIELRSQGQDVQVLVIEWSRWARNTIYSLESLDKLESAGVQVIETTTGRPLTMRTSAGLVDAGLKSLMAHGYSLDLSDRLKRSYVHRRQIGKPMAGPVPWGYQRGEGNKAYEPSEDWSLCREVIDRYIAGATFLELTRWLKDEHGITKSDVGLRHWLNNPVLRGHLAYNGQTELKYNTHPALITEEEWASIRSRMRLNRKLRGKNKGRVYAIAADLLQCSVCGGALHTYSNHHWRYFCCYNSKKRGDCSAPRKYVREDWVEAAIQNALQERAEEIAGEVSRPSGEIVNPREIELRRELADLEELHKATRRESIKLALDEVRAELEAIKNADSVKESTFKTQRRIILAMRRPDFFEGIVDEDRRAIYTDLVEVVRILGPEVVEVKLKI